MRELILFLILTISSSAAFAANICVGPEATGIGDGSDWNNLKDWSGTPTRGDTWYLIDGTYSGKTFNRATSGITLITIKKATEFDHGGISTGWNDNLGNNQAIFSSSLYIQTSYWVLDGAKGDTWSQNLADYGFRFADGASSGIRLGAVGANLHDVSISHFSALASSSDVEKVFLDVINLSYPVTDNVTLSHCLLNGWQVAVRAGGTGGPTMSNWVFEYSVVLNGFSSSANHGEDISNGYGNAISRVVRFNLFRGRKSGTGTVITLNHSSSGDMIYGNVFHSQSGGNGVIGIGSSGFSMTNAKVFNNTFINCNSPWLGFSQTGYTFSNSIARNNLLYNMTGSGSSSGWSVDYTAYYSTVGTNNDSHIQTGSGDPMVNSASSNYSLKSNSAAGVDVCTLNGITCDADHPYNFDAFRRKRNSWTRGAIEFETGTLPPSAPKNFRIDNT